MIPCDGDVNRDNSITPKDAQIAFDKAMLVCPTLRGIPCYFSKCNEVYVCCDVTQDEDCTPADALCIFNKSLGKPSCLD